MPGVCNRILVVRHVSHCPDLVIWNENERECQAKDDGKLHFHCVEIINAINISAEYCRQPIPIPAGICYFCSLMLFDIIVSHLTVNNYMHIHYK